MLFSQNSKVMRISYHVMDNKIIDMGAGLERLSWITMGTPTSYDCAFGPIVQEIGR